MVERGRDAPWALLAGYVLLASAATVLLGLVIVAIFVWNAEGATAASAREPTTVAVVALHLVLALLTLRFARAGGLSERAARGWAAVALVPVLTFVVPVALVARTTHQGPAPAISRASARSRGVSMSNERSDGIT